MNKTILVKDNDKGKYIYSVVDFLETIKDYDKYFWKLFYFDGMGGPQKIFDQSFEEINRSQEGIFMTWDQLKEVAAGYDQLIWMGVVADKGMKKVEDCTRDSAKSGDVEYCIELFDSSFYLVFASEDSLRQFYGIENVTVEDTKTRNRIGE